MKVIIEDLNNEKYSLNLSEEQVKLVKWLTRKDFIYNVEVIEEMDWGDIK